MCRQLVAGVLVLALGGLAPSEVFAAQRVRPIEEPVAADPGQARLLAQIKHASETLTRVNVLMCDGRRVRGTVLSLSRQTFEFREEHSGSVSHVRYADVVCVLPKHRHLALKGVLVGVGLTVTLKYLLAQVRR